MKSISRLFIIFLFMQFCCSQSSYGQDRSRLRISILTCTPGSELYSIFGHSAIRVIDSNAVSDLVFNYGTFDFNEAFYLKFVKGKLLYYISVARTDAFIEDYIQMRRGITEQLLQLTNPEKQTLYNALIENCKEENRYYKYDFFLDNCTTRLRDLLKNNISTSFDQPYIMPEKTTFRMAIHQYLENGGQHWSELGIDLLLGAKTDRVMTAAEQEFLPDNLMMALDANQKNKWIESRIDLYPSPYQSAEKTLLTPLNCFGLIALFVLLLSFYEKKRIRFLLPTFDFLLYFSFGAIGIILFLAWFFTDHTMTKNNYNLIWALPTHFVFSFFQFKKNKFQKTYFLFNALLMSLLVVSWFFLPQLMNIALLPLIMIMAIRSYIRFKQTA